MKRHIQIICIIVGLFAWLGLGMEFAFAQDKIYPVGATYPFAPIPNSPITISLINPQTNANSTGSWLPEPGNEVRIQVNGASGTIVLMPAVPNPIIQKAFATSAYPGECTNYGTSTAADYSLQGDVLTSYDNGGMAAVVVNVGGTDYRFIIPQDSNFNGIPDIYESQYGGVGALARDGDIDTGPDPSSPLGDGIANVDEYRGFRVGGAYIRGDPTRKDLFVHLEETPQCTTGTVGNFTDQTGLVRLATFFPGINGLGDLYANVNTLLPDARVHRINNEEWVSKFSSWDKTNYVTLSGTDQGQDRWINKNSIATTLKVVKGVRIIECLDLSILSPLGQSDKHPPDLTTKDNGNAVLYTHRIVKYFLNLITGVNQPMVYYTFENGSWVSKESIGTPQDITNPSVSDLKVVRLMQLVLPWYLAHEALEHSFDVTATVQTTRKASYGYHHADGSGTNVDIKITNTLTSQANKFYIPKYFGISDEREMRVISFQ